MDPDTPSGDIEDTSQEQQPSITIGRTSTGKVFQVPKTSDMVSAIFRFSSNRKKSLFDLATLAVMGIQLLAFFTLPSSVKQPLFFVLFLLWRMSYNFGLGILLKYQSDKKGLVVLAKRYGIFEAKKDDDDDKEKNPKDEASPHLGTIRKFIKRELCLKMGPDYDFDAVPVEYNTWLLFRCLVDLILMNDFTTYLCFALSFLSNAFVGSFWSIALRWTGGLVLILFNLWVKLDAHRVVKDFAWYWGDFFFLVDADLTFDGVFEMAPHPMYSVGYAGYYGVSIMTASYWVLFGSLAAHAAQFIFLVLVENPHIDKTYNQPPPLPRAPSGDVSAVTGPYDAEEPEMSPHIAARNIYNTYFRRDLIILKNFDPYRASDLLVVCLIFYAGLIPLVLGQGPDGWGAVLCVAQCLFWRLVHSVVLGAILHYQSTSKFWSKHFIKFGGSNVDAFESWKSIYNLSLCMTYVTFVVAAVHMYDGVESEWSYGSVVLRHTLGLLLIALHIWASVSVFQVLGEFGWFYGDFFIDEYPSTLYYTGIYRFLNNPEKVMGHAAFWGITLICNSKLIFFIALLSQILNFLFIHYVESPHMRKLYGDKIREESGINKAVRNAKVLPKRLSKVVEGTREHVIGRVVEAEQALGKVVGRAEKVVGETKELVDKAKPRIQELYSQSRAIIAETIEEDSLNGIDTTRYSIKLFNESSQDLDSRNHGYPFGSPIRIAWTAPPGHSTKDWIGIYRVTDNPSGRVTSVPSHGLYLYVHPQDDEKNVEKSCTATELSERMLEKGELIFEGERMPWDCGTYEFRYHHDGKHGVTAISEPFDVYVDSPREVPNDDAELSVSTIEETLLPLVARCFERQILGPFDYFESLAPAAPDREVRSRRVVAGIRAAFGIDFSWKVVELDACERRLAKRIHDARVALNPIKSTSINSPIDVERRSKRDSFHQIPPASPTRSNASNSPWLKSRRLPDPSGTAAQPASKDDDARYMTQAISQANLCTPSETAYSVGAVLVRDGTVLSTGYSRELPGNTHAEECCLLKLGRDEARGATIYSTMEPCDERLSGKKPCARLLLETGIVRVVIGVREPDRFVKECNGTRALREGGVQVDVMEGKEEECLRPNRHVLRDSFPK